MASVWKYAQHLCKHVSAVFLFVHVSAFRCPCVGVHMHGFMCICCTVCPCFMCMKKRWEKIGLAQRLSTFLGSRTHKLAHTRLQTSSQGCPSDKIKLFQLSVPQLRRLTVKRETYEQNSHPYTCCHWANL